MDNNPEPSAGAREMLSADADQDLANTPLQVKQRRPRSRRFTADPNPEAESAGQPAPQAAVLEVEAAMAEILAVPAAAIHRAAALQWAARAVAGYRACLLRPDLQACLSFFYLGEHYREAALAHAAMGEGWEPLHAEVDRAMAPDRTVAFAAMRTRSGETGPQGGGPLGRPPAGRDRR